MLFQGLFYGDTAAMGRGVFTKLDIAADTIIESSPVIVMTREERILLDQTKLHDYIFEWGDDHDRCCMAMGYVALYNHAYHSNCEYEMDFENEIITIRAVRDIRAGEELFINYNGDYDDMKELWFPVN